MEKFDALLEYRTSPLVTRTPATRGAGVRGRSHPQQASFRRNVRGELRNHFSKPEIAEITWVNALENFFDLKIYRSRSGSDGFCSIAQARKKGALRVRWIAT